MIKNYFKIAYRNFVRHKSFTMISILSLSIAMLCALLIGIYALSEFSYDENHKLSEDIYRLVTVSQNQDAERTTGFVPLPLAPYLQENVPGVRNYARIWKYRRSMPVANPEREIDFYEDNFAWAEDTFFELFDFTILEGNRVEPLGDMRSVVISRTMADKYFGTENPIGKVLHFRGETEIPIRVTAVMEDMPANSHFHFDFIANIKGAAEDFWAGGRVGQEFFDQWVNLFVPAYILIEPGAELDPILAEATRQVNQHFEVPGSSYRVIAQPLTDIHLTSQLDIGEWEVNGSLKNVYVILAVGLIVLILGCFNFVNLVTAQSGQRTKEVGLRKTMGGTRRQLMVQHYFESVLLVLAALVVSIVMVELLRPWLSGFIVAGDPLALLIKPIPILVAGGVLIALIVLSGAYPTLFVSRFNPSDVLKGTFSGNAGGSTHRKVLVTLQFALSGALIVCTLIIYQQLDFMKEKELGFQGEQIVVIPIHSDRHIIPNFDRLKQAYLQNSNVSGMTASSHLMFATFTYTNSFRLQGTDRDLRWERYTVEGDYPKVYDLKLIEGRYFRPESPADTNAVILNHRAVAELGMEPEEVVGRQIENRSMGITGEVVGVVENFHYQSIHEAIQPFVLVNQPEIIDFISVKINPNQVEETIDFMEATWNRVIPEATFGYYFLDNTFGALYEREENLSSTILAFSLVAIFLACLGLFGLAMFMARRRTKEIGVRKVLGATVQNIVFLLGKDFTRLVVLSLILAFPLSWMLMKRWLTDYAYHIDISIWYFVGGGLFVMALAWLTVSWHALRAATADPVKSIQSE